MDNADPRMSRSRVVDHKRSLLGSTPPRQPTNCHGIVRFRTKPGASPTCRHVARHSNAETPLASQRPHGEGAVHPTHPLPTGWDSPAEPTLVHAPVSHCGSSHRLHTPAASREIVEPSHWNLAGHETIRPIIPNQPNCYRLARRRPGKAERLNAQTPLSPNAPTSATLPRPAITP